MTTQYKPIKISGKFYWAQFAKQNEMSGKYQFDFGNLSDKAVAVLEDLGLPVRNKEDRGNYLTFKSTRPIEAFDADGNVISSREGVQAKSVGNGSTGVVTVGFYDWEFKGKKGRSPSAKRVVVEQLVEFDAADEDEVPV